MAFKAKRPVLIRIQPQYVKDIKSGEKKEEYRSREFVDCNCLILHQSQEGQGIVAVAEVGSPEPVINEEGKKRYEYPILRVFDFKETIPIETAFDNTPIKRKISSRYQDFTYLRDNGEWTPESEAAAAEAVKILLKTHPYKIVYPKEPKEQDK